MTVGDKTRRDGTAAMLEVAARRGPEALDAAIARLTAEQQAAVPEDFLNQLYSEAAAAALRVADDKLQTAAESAFDVMSNGGNR